MEGFECGMSVDNYSDVKVGDVFEVVERVQVAKKLGPTIAETKAQEAAEAAKRALSAKPASS